MFTMQTLIISGVIASFLGAFFVALFFLGRAVRRSGRTGSAVGAAMAAYNQAMNSTAYDQFVEVEAERDRAVVVPSPDPYGNVPSPS